MKKYVIVGGVAGGATTAARLRRLDEEAEIIMVEKGGYISYANCGLPYYIGKTISERKKLFLQTPESFFARFKVDVRIHSEVTSVNPSEKTVTIKSEKGEYTESYDKLILSPGAIAIVPPLEGIDSEGIFTLRNVEDTDRVFSYLENNNIKKAVVIGAGFIGLEMAENLHDRGIEVTVAEALDQVMAPLDFEMASLIHEHLREKGIGLSLSDPISGFSREGGSLKVQLKSGRVLESDMAILSIGVKPNSSLAKDAGLNIGERGAIEVDEYLQTSDPHIYALGDVIEFKHPITNETGSSYLAGPANRQGRILADNLVYGHSVKYRGSIGTAIAKVFDLSVAATGVNEKTLKRLGWEYYTSITHSASHAGYYPGATQTSIKLIYTKEGKILGGQVVGKEGVDKRTDMIASVISMGGSVEDLKNLEHSYAPPFSSAKDPVTVAALAAENILRGISSSVTYRELDDLFDDIFLLDVRTAREYGQDHIQGAVNIPVDELRSRIDEIPRDKQIVVYCGVGLRAYVALRQLKQKGFTDTANLSGGIRTYRAARAENLCNENCGSGF